MRVGAALLLAELASGALKELVERDRPPVARPDPAPLVGLPETYSFPSGHAATAFAAATTLALAVPRLRVPLFALAAGVAWSRVWVGVHFPLDVLAGAALGVAIALVVRWLPRAVDLRRRGAARSG